MRCVKCGIKIPELPEDASYDEQLCNRCCEELEKGGDDGDDL